MSTIAPLSRAEIHEAIADCEKIRDRQRRIALECRADGLMLAAQEHDRKAAQEEAMAEYFRRKL